LFPEDDKIPMAKMVDYCIGGGSIGSSSSSSSSRPSDINSLRCNGRNIISELIDACLLERMDDIYGDPCVKVHDAIRDMILWPGGKSNRTGHKILTLAGEDHKGVYYVDDKTWQDESMVSLRDNDITEVNINGNSATSISSSFCRGKGKISWQNNNLQVLLLQWNKNLKNLPRSLFEYFPKLRVLDLSDTHLEELPESLWLLKSLEYLSLSWTKIEALPKEMGYLTNLMLLDLSHTSQLCKIRSGVFSSLSKLQSMNLCNCRFFGDNAGKKKVQKVLKEVDGLPLLKEVGLSFVGDPDAIKFLLDESNTLSKSITKLHINSINLISYGLFRRISSELKKLEKLVSLTSWMRIRKRTF
jgi:disease resistance protein RPS2